LAAVQTRVHHALTQTVKEAAVYSYLFDVIGATDMIRNADALAADSRRDINGFLNNAADIYDAVSDGRGALGGVMSGDMSQISVVSNSMDTISESAGAGFEQFKNWADNPREFFSGLTMVLFQKGTATAFDAFFSYWIAPALFDKYMQTGRHRNAQSYLRSMGVLMDGYNIENGLTFTTWEWSLRDGVDNTGLQGSSFLEGGDEITLRVEYYFDLSRFIRILPEELTKLKVVQQVSTKAWVGDGTRYGGNR
jgi:hypothetical protein